MNDNFYAAPAADDTAVVATPDYAATIAELEKQVQRLNDLHTHWHGIAVTAERRIASIKSEVHEFFQNAFDGATGDVKISKSDANELLESIEAELLPTKWDVTIRVEVTATVEASSEEEAIQMVEDALVVRENGTDIEDFDWEVTNTEASESDDN